MTDDEAFVRAIVAAPGDDAPRLVYADWLDERGDPRAAYLREEAARPGDSHALRARANKLDPVWVARISRPPVGVCCEHMTFTDRGPNLDVEDTFCLDRLLGAPIPADYRAFLLNYNGGIPHLITEFKPSDPPLLPVVVRRLFPLDPESNQRAGTLNTELESYSTVHLPRFLEREPYQATSQEVQWYRAYVPVADTVDTIFTVLLGVQAPYADDVRLIDWSVESTSFEHSAGYRIASNFADFLGRLIPATSDYGSILDRVL